MISWVFFCPFCEKRNMTPKWRVNFWVVNTQPGNDHPCLMVAICVTSLRLCRFYIQSLARKSISKERWPTGAEKNAGNHPALLAEIISHIEIQWKIGGLLLGLAASRHGTLCGSGFKMFQIRFTEKNGIKDDSITMKCGYNCLRLDLWWWISNKHRGVWYYFVFIPNNGPIPKDWGSVSGVRLNHQPAKHVLTFR